MCSPVQNTLYQILCLDEFAILISCMLLESRGGKLLENVELAKSRNTMSKIVRGKEIINKKLWYTTVTDRQVPSEYN